MNCLSCLFEKRNILTLWSQRITLLGYKFNMFSTINKGVINLEPDIKTVEKNVSKQISSYRYLRVSSLISNDQKENIYCAISVVQRDILGPSYDTTPAAVVTCKTLRKLAHAIYKEFFSFKN